MKYDIQIHGNAISGRQGWAYTCNSNEIPVLKADINSRVNAVEGAYKNFGSVRVAWSYRGHESFKPATLECDNGRWYLGGHGCCISSRFTFEDTMELINIANYPIVKAGQTVAIALFDETIDYSVLTLFKVGEKIDINCQVIADLTPLTDEEMQEVKKRAAQWCVR